MTVPDDRPRPTPVRRADVPEEASALLDVLLREVRDEVARAETKASTLFAATGVLVAIVATVATSAGLDGGELGTARRICWFVGCFAVVTANGALAASIWPRRASEHLEGWPAWFGDVAAEARRAPSSQEGLQRFTERLTAAPPDPFARGCHQLWTMSRIADAKHRAIRVALVLFGIGMLLIVLPATAA